MCSSGASVLGAVGRQDCEYGVGLNSVAPVEGGKDP